MLLQSLITQQQSAYTDLQIQIEELQEQQRKIQSYLQQLGSVESQMITAVQSLQQAIASVREVCPSEIINYQDTVMDLFSSPIAMLAEADCESEDDSVYVQAESMTESSYESDNESGSNPVETTDESATDSRTDSQSGSIVQFPTVTNSEPESEIIYPELGEKPDPSKMFRAKIAHGGKHYIINWRVIDNEAAANLFKELKIRPTNQKKIKAEETVSGKGLFADNNDCFQAYITSNAYSKLEATGNTSLDVLLD